MSDYQQLGIDAYSAEGLSGKVGVAEFNGPAVIVSSIGARCGKCFLAKDDFTTLANVHVVFPNKSTLNANYLWNLVNDERFWPRYATAQPFIRPSDIRKSWIPVPPLGEQAAISRILDAVDEAVKRVKDTIDRVRDAKRSVLEAAFQDLDAPTRRLKDYTTDVRYGTSKASSERGWGLPVLRIPNIVGDKLDVGDLAFVELPKADANRLLLQRGDLLLVRTNGNPHYVGRSAVFEPPDERTWVFASYLIRVRLCAALLPAFVNVYLGLERGRRELLRRVTTSAGNHNINSNSIGLLQVPVPNRREDQVRIIDLAAAFRARESALAMNVRAFDTLKRSLTGDLLTGRVRVHEATKAVTV